MSSQMSAIDLLKLGDEGRKKPFLNDIFHYVLGFSFGVGTGCFLNIASRRPPFSGLQKHILGVIVWTSALTFLYNKRQDYYAEKDAVFRHYIELHPEDFSEPERKKFADILEPWVPVR